MAINPTKDIKVPADRLTIGMFVHDLDRPWVDTPFLFQSFLVETVRHVEALRKYCKFVWVDPVRSQPHVIPADLLNQTRAELSKDAFRTDISLLPPAQRKARLLELRSLFHDGRVLRETVLYENTRSMSEEMPAARKSISAARETAKSVMQTSRSELGRHLPHMRDVVEAMVESIVRNPKAMMWLTRLRSADPYTYSHLVDTSIYLIAFGRHLGFPQPILQTLGMAGLLIDVGKLELPADLLAHSGPLTPEQFEKVKEHVQRGLDILCEIDTVTTKVLEIVARHHERLDGSGYPERLVGDSIGMFGGMAGIVDVYTAITCDRPYAKAQSTLDAFRTLYDVRDSQFHAALVEQFIQTIGIYPVGSLVELTTGEVGIVVKENRLRRLKPRVMVLLDAQKRPLSYPGALDLIGDPLDAAGEPIAIARELRPDSHGLDLRQFFQ